jgi:hypothetical protein
VFLGADARELAGAGLSVGILSAGQGRYSLEQLLLDIGQGARVSSSAYREPAPPALSVRATGPGALIEGWRGVLARAGAAPQELSPGILAGQVPGGGAYAGSPAVGEIDAVAAAGPRGRVAALSLGSPGSLVARTLGLLNRSRLVVADLPGGAAGVGDLDGLARRRAPGTLLIALQRVHDERRGALLWAGVAGLGPGRRELTSPSTRQAGLIVSVDIAPTVLDWLGLAVPGEVRGRSIESAGPLDTAALSSLISRLRVIGARRLPALGFLLCSWLVLLACARSPRARAWAIRTGALAVLWAPVAVMATAALEPSAGVEYAMIALICLALGALSDLLVRWPGALIAPALAAPLAITVDALGHGQLLLRSLLGPDPALGARFYGIGNELKSGLAVLVLAAVAAAFHRSRSARRAPAAFLAAGVALAAIEGSARIGAAVGGVILVCVAFALAAVLVAPGAVDRRRILLVALAPLAGLGLLAAGDVLFAHGSGHFNASILHARSAGDIRDLIVRRYRAAWQELGNHAMPAATVIALAAAALAVRARRRLLGPVGGARIWEAALAGGLAAGLAGALVEDSGPVLLVVAVFALGCVLSYLWGGSRSVSPRTPAFGSSRPSAARSSGSERPSTRTSFSRVLAPRTTETLRTPTPARLAISRQRASLAFPSTGAAQTRTSSSPPRSPTIRFSLARGDSLTAISEISMRRG